ncbi:MAG: tryptophan synthase subunit alpha [Acidobacteria bacterium]|nr:tryptophan synthase subunit alpha [Acidobacteriota bacterium]
MSRLDDTFKALRAAKRTGLVAYVTAGDPDLARSAEVVRAVDRGGADVIELGVPFSDPLADGPVIQRATARALAQGATLAKVLDMAASLRAEVKAPLVLFTYANPVVRMGLPAFAARAAAAGIDGVLVLDLPPEEAGEARDTFVAAGLDTIFLLSPTTSVPRIRRAAELGGGFLYGISRLGVTGARSDVADSAEALASRVRAETDRPLALGFGFSTPEHVRAVGAFADAAVVGSALVQVIADHGASPTLGEEVERYVRGLRS